MKFYIVNVGGHFKSQVRGLTQLLKGEYIELRLSLQKDKNILKKVTKDDWVIIDGQHGSWDSIGDRCAKEFAIYLREFGLQEFKTMELHACRTGRGFHADLSKYLIELGVKHRSIVAPFNNGTNAGKYNFQTTYIDKAQRKQDYYSDRLERSRSREKEQKKYWGQEEKRLDSEFSRGKINRLDYAIRYTDSYHKHNNYIQETQERQNRYKRKLDHWDGEEYQVLAPSHRIAIGEIDKKYIDNLNGCKLYSQTKNLNVWVSHFAPPLHLQYYMRKY